MKFVRWVKARLFHKFDHFRPAVLADTLKENGLSLVVIIITWEIIEDIGFPLLFIWLGKNVHPIFIAGVPASWLLCLHWLMVPLTWRWWMKFKNRMKK